MRIFYYFLFLYLFYLLMMTDIVHIHPHDSLPTLLVFVMLANLDNRVPYYLV